LSDKVVGVNTAVAGIGLGLAVPINTATRAVIGALMTEGRVRRAYLGVGGGQRPLPPKAREQFGNEDAVEIVEVRDGSAADKAGLRRGDLIVELAGERITTVAQLQRLLQRDVIGTRLPATVLRDGLERKLVVVPTELPNGD
jgi:S1-C subfamily serine protease